MKLLLTKNTTLDDAAAASSRCMPDRNKKGLCYGGSGEHIDTHSGEGYSADSCSSMCRRQNRSVRYSMAAGALALSVAAASGLLLTLHAMMPWVVILFLFLLLLCCCVVVMSFSYAGGAHVGMHTSLSRNPCGISLQNVFSVSLGLSTVLIAGYAAFGGYVAPVLGASDPLGAEPQNTVLLPLNSTAPDLSNSGFFADPPVAQPGEPITYTLVLTNAGSTPLTHTHVLNSIPDHTSYLVGSASSISGTTTYSSASNILEWNGTVPANTALSITYRVAISPTLTAFSFITNTATLSAPLLADPLTIEAHTCMSCDAAESVYPMYRSDAQRRGISLSSGIQDPLWVDWAFPAAASVVASPVIAPDGTILVGAGNEFFALNPDGSLQWSYDAGATIQSSAAVARDGTVYIGAGSYLIALLPDGTDKRWRYDAGSQIQSSPVIGPDGAIYIAATSGMVSALRPNGTVQWEYSTGAPISYSSPALAADGTVYIGTDGYLYAISDEGQLVKSYAIGTSASSTPAISPNGTIYIGTTSGYLYAFLPSGDQEWVHDTGKPIYAAPTVGLDGRIYVAAGNDLYAVAADSSQRELLHSAGSQIYSSPTMDPSGTIYVGSADGRLYSVAQDGTLIGSYLTGASITYSSPAIGADGTIYIGSEDQHIYALVRDERPTTIHLSNTDVDEHDSNLPVPPAGELIGTLTATSPVPGDVFTYTLINSAEGRVRLGGSNGEELQIADWDLFDYESATEHQIEVRAVNVQGFSFDQSFTLNVRPVNEFAPQNLDLAPQFVYENSADDTPIGLLTFADADAGDRHDFSIRADSCGCFGIVDNTLVVADGAALDYEQHAAHTVEVRVIDRGNLSTDGVFTIEIRNVNEAPLAENDSYLTTEDSATPLTIAAPGLLDNDSDPEGSPLNAAIETHPAHGSLGLEADGSFTYQPYPDFNGIDTFTYRASDGVNTAVATVQISVTPVPDAPVAEADAYSTPQDTTLTIPADIGLLANDHDADNDPLQAIVVTGPAYGSLSLSDDGSFTYIPQPGYDGTVSFTYKAHDGSNDSAGATVTIAIQDNNIPIALNDSYNTGENRPLNIDATIGVLTNDTDGNNDALVAELDTSVSASSGELSLASDGSFIYTPATDFTGNASFTYRVFDGKDFSNIATVTISVGSNDAPLANPDSYSIDEDQQLTIASPGLLDNDNDLDGDSLIAVQETSTSHGSLVVSPDGSFSYIPDADFAGTDTFTYYAYDGSETSNSATVSINVISQDDLPVAMNDTYSTPQHTELTVEATVGLLINDRDADGDDLTIAIVDAPAHGTLNPNTASGAFTYLPDAGFAGTDTFTYEAHDGTQTSNIATVSIVIAPNNVPVAYADSYTTSEGTSLQIASLIGVLVNDTDDDADTLIAILDTTPAHGSLTFNTDGSFSYVPDVGFSGIDTFTYFAFDGKEHASTPSTVSINVIANAAPNAHSDSYSTNEDTVLVVNATVGVLANDTDPEGSSLTALLVTNVQHGQLLFHAAAGDFTYTPAEQYHGTDTFTYQAFDGQAESQIVTATITIVPANDAPVALADSFHTFEQTPLNVDAEAGLLINDNDHEDDPLIVEIISYTANGTLTPQSDGSFTYIPDTGFIGSDTFSYRVYDGHAYSAEVTVTITVMAEPEPPIALPDSYSMAEDTVLTVEASGGLLTNDSAPSGNPLTAQIISQPTYGTLTPGATGGFTYTPVQHFVGQVSFTYRAYDGVKSSETTTVTIEIAPANDPPVATADTYTAEESTLLTIDAAAGVLSNDTDIEHDELTLIRITNTTQGELSLNSDGSFTYAPISGATGTDSFSYRAYDGTDYSEIVDVTISIQPNTPPTAHNDSYTTAEDTDLVIDAAVGLLASDSDANHDPLSVHKIADPLYGYLLLQPDGAFVYTPNEHFTGIDSFTYQAFDGKDYSTTATVTISVTPVNDPPIANGETYITSEDNVFAIGVAAGVLSNDFDAEMNDLIAVPDKLPTYGALALMTDGSFTYTPAPHFNGSDSFTYRAYDGNIYSDAVTVTINVHPINDVPQARHDTFSMLEDTELNRSASAGVMANDTDIDGDTMIAVQQKGPTYGTLMLDPNGAFVYRPDADFFGTDYFTYYLSDTIDDSPITTATITVWPSNDAPVGFNDTYTATEDTVLKIMAANGVLTNDYDLDTGDMLRATLQSDPVSGTLLSFATDGSFQYLPAANFSGSDSFTYRVYDGAAYSADIVVTLTVQPTNDAPVAVNDAYTIASNRTLTVDTVNGLLTNDSDLDGDNLQSIRTGDTAHGTLTMQADGSFTYTPEADFTGTDSFTYQATDSKEASPDATVVISVGTNQPPTAAPDFFAVDEDTTLNLSAAHSILFNDTDPDGDALQAEPQSNPLYGTLSLAPDGALIYTPGQDFHGIDSFTYRAFDGIDYSDDATAIITVNPINDLPLAADDRYDAIKDTPLTIAAGNGLLANDSDIDGDNLQSIRTGDAAHGTLEVQADGSFTYTPELGFVGLDSFAYEAHDPDGAISSATVTIVVEERSIATPTPTVTPPLPEQPILPIQFVDAVYEVEEDGTTGQVHVTLKRTDPTATEQAVSVYYETINGTAQFDIDYLYKSDQVTIAAGETEASFTIDIVNDTLPEGDEEFWLRLSTSRIAMHKGIPARFSVVRPDDAIAAAHTAPATNIDDARVIIHDTHDIESVSGGVLQFSANTYNVDENDGEIEITVFRSGGSVGEVSVDYATIGQTATDGSDFTALAGTLTLQPDEVITSFTVPILPDTLEEGDETILLSLSSPTGDATLGTQHQAELTIIDKDYNPQGTLQFEHIAYRVNEGDSVATIRVKRVGGSTSDIQVRYEMFDGTAQAGDDYRISRGLLRFGPGETLKSFDIDILQDGSTEGTETAYLQLSEPMGGANLGSQSEAILYIDDDDITDYGTIQLAKAAYHVREDTANAIITLERIGSSAGAVSVAYETIDSTAQAGEDYESMEGVMSFADGVTHATFAVPIIPDTETEGDEVLLLHLSSATGAILGSQDTVPLTIVDDDTATHAAGVLQFSKTTYYVGEDASYATIEVERIGGSSGTVTVDCTTSDDTAHAGLDYMPQSTTLTFLPDERTQTFEVEILPSAGGTVLLQLSNPGGDALIGSHDQSLLRIGNKTVSDFQMNTPFYRVNEQDGHITIIVERSGDISSPATIAYATRDKDAVSPDDYEAQDNILEFPAGDSILQFDITIMEDQKIEGNEVFEVVLIDGNKDQSIAEVLIEDNDYGDKSTIQFSSRSYSVSEDTEDGGLWINVFRAGNVAGEASIRYDIFANTAEEGMDYLYTTDILTFTDGQAMSGFKVMITDDNEVEGSETIDLRLQNVTGDGTWIGAPHQAILTIVDDNTTAEGTLEFSADSYEVMEDDTQKTITVFRTGGTNGTVTIDYVAFDGTAVEEEDFVRVEGTLTFEHGQSTATFEVPILDDDAVEGVEVLRLQLIEGSVTGDAVFGARNEAVLTIIDSDSVPEGVIRFSDPTYLVSENSALTDEEHTQILIGIEREGGSSKAVEVTLMTLDGTATDGKDYIAREDPIIFAAGETQQYFPITIKDDFIAEGDETVTLILTKPTNGAVLGTQNYAVLKIFDDEPPGVEFSAPHYQVSETALTVPITVTLVEPLTQTVYIDYHTEDGTATAGEDYDRVNGTLEFLPSETFKAFSVTVHNDMHVEPPEEVNLRLDIPDGLGRGEFISSTLTIQDPPILSDTGLRIIKLEAPATRMLAGFSNKLPITATVTYDGYQPVSEQKVQFHTNLGMIIPEDGIVMTDNFGRARIFLQGDGTEGIATIEAALINDANVQAAQPSANLAVELYLERLYLPIVSADSRGQPNLSFYATVDKKVIVVGGKEELSIKLERCVGIGVCLPVSNVKATIFTSLGTFGSTQSTTVREADDEGIVQVELDPGERPGTAHMRIIVEDDEAIGVRSTNIQVIHGPAESILLRANRNRLLVGDQTGIRAAITDAFGNPIPGQPIQFSVTGGSITPEQTSLNDAGIATANLTCPDNAADITITASIGDLSEQFSIACVPEGPDQIEWHVPQTPIEARLENTAHVRVRLLDVYDNPLPNQPVSFHSLFGDLDSPHMVTDSNGEATVTLSNPTLRIGPIAVNAASGRVHSEETITFTPLECVESEPNNFIRDADDLQLWNVACRGMLGPQEDEDDYYRIRVEASTALSVYLRDLPADYNLQLGFYNEEVIAQSIGYGLTDEHLAYQLEPHIDYYLRVSQREAAEPHTYTLSVLMHPHHRP